MTEESRTIGLSREEAEKRLGELSPLYIEKMERLKLLVSGPNGSISSEFALVKAQAEALEARMNWIRDWYSLGVWEDLSEDSSRLRKLTIGLLFMTAVLAILTAVLVWRTV